MVLIWKGDFKNGLGRLFLLIRHNGGYVMIARKSRILPTLLCVLALLTTVAIPNVIAITPVEIYGYIHLDDGADITQLAFHPITILDDNSQSSQQVLTDQYGFFSLVLMEPIDALYTDTITLDVSYYDPQTQNMIYDSTTITITPYMRADPTFTISTQICEWYEDIEAPAPGYSPHSDQTVFDLYFSQEFAFEGDDVTIYADIMNVGDIDLMNPTTVRFYDGEMLIPHDEIVIESIEMSDIETVEIIWVNVESGEHLVRSVVGEEKSFAEIRNGNNGLSGNFIVLTYGGDYDSDGLTNWDEYNDYGTSPIDPDTDDDGLPDGWEVNNGLSPLNDGRIDPIHGPNGDQDGDGLINLYEFSNSFDNDGNPSSNPWVRDTDGDTLTDFEELNGIQISGGQTVWFEKFENGIDLDWNVERSNENNLIGLETNRYISSPFSLCLETTTDGYAFGTSPPLDIDYNSDYTISFHFRLGETTNQWIEVISNGQVTLAIDPNNKLCHMNGGTPNAIITTPLLPFEWYYIQCIVSPSANTYEVKININSEKTGISFNEPNGYDHLRFGSMVGRTSEGKAFWDNIILQYSTPSRIIQTDPSARDTDLDGLNDNDEIITYGTDPTDYDTDDDSFLPYFDFNDGVEVQLWEDPDGYDLLPAVAGERAKNKDIDVDMIPDGMEVFMGFNPVSDERTNVKWQIDDAGDMHVVWQEHSSPDEICYKNNVNEYPNWNTEVQITATATLDVYSVQPRLSVSDTEVYIEWMEVIDVIGTWNGKWKMANIDITDNYNIEDFWHFTDFYYFLRDSSNAYATIYPISNPFYSEIVYPEPPPYFLKIDPDDFTHYWAITPIDTGLIHTPWQPEPIQWPVTDDLALLTPRLDEIKRRIEDYDPGYDDNIYVYVGPTPEGDAIFAILDLWDVWGGTFRARASEIEIHPDVPPIYFDPAFDDDSDGDGLGDIPEDTIYSTDKYDPDTDDDHYFAFSYNGDSHYTFTEGDEKEYWNREIGRAGGLEGWERNFDGDQDGKNNLLDPDSDNDEMWDGWELYYGFEPYDNGQVDYKGGNVDANKGKGEDYEGDGLDNELEFDLTQEPLYIDVDGDHDTDPTVGDTDNDRLDDGPEVYFHRTDPTAEDTDGDGLSDGDEVIIHGTDPTNPDSDGDGLNDGQEISRGTDPNNPHSDSDDLEDGEEVQGWDILVNGQTRHVNSDPTLPDTDYDGLNDREEKEETLTDPRDTDTDDDGTDNNEFTDSEERSWGTKGYNSYTDDDNLKDGEEVNGVYVENLGKTVYSDPHLEDSDSDGLWDGAEVLGVWLPNLERTVFSDPSNDHTDNDDIIDGVEVNQYKIDPNDMDSDEDGMDDNFEKDYWGPNYNQDYDGDGRNNIGDYDSDGDMISDSQDVDPVKYNRDDGSIFSYHRITVNNRIGVSVAIQYDTEDDIQPVIINIVEPSLLWTGIDKEVDVTTSSSDTFTVIIRFIYSDDDLKVNEDSLVLYSLDESSNTWHLGGDTGVYINYNIVWTETTHLTNWLLADDVDQDDLRDNDEPVDISPPIHDNAAGDDGNTLGGVDPDTLLYMDDLEVVIAYENGDSQDDPNIRTFDVYVDSGITVGDDWSEDDTIHSDTIEFVVGNFDDNLEDDEIVTVWESYGNDVELRLFDVDMNLIIDEIQPKWTNQITVDSKSIIIHAGEFDGDDQEEIVIAYENADLEYDPNIRTFNAHVNTGITVGDDWSEDDNIHSYTIEFVVGNFDDNLDDDEIVTVWENYDNDVEVRLFDVDTNLIIDEIQPKWENDISVDSKSIIIHAANLDAVWVDAGDDITTQPNIPTVFSAAKITEFAKRGGDSFTYTWTWEILDNAGNFVERLDGQNPVYTFAATGTYTATVTISNGFEGDTDTLTVTVIALTTLPGRADTDGDTLFDGDEYYGDTSNGEVGRENQGWDFWWNGQIENPRHYITSPLMADTDGDGVNDNRELIEETNPLDPFDNNLDTDNDGINDHTETH